MEGDSVEVGEAGEEGVTLAVADLEGVTLVVTLGVALAAPPVPAT
jgi:hypothetical protein